MSAAAAAVVTCLAVWETDDGLRHQCQQGCTGTSYVHRQGWHACPCGEKQPLRKA